MPTQYKVIAFSGVGYNYSDPSNIVTLFTHGNGKISAGPFSARAEEFIEPITQFGLRGNYPQPFNPTTAIEYDLDAAGYMDLRVYDPLGREVAILADGYKDAGRHRAQFDARSLSSGIYLFKLVAGGKISWSKGLLLK